MAKNPHHLYLTGMPNEVLTGWHKSTKPHKIVTCDVPQGVKISADHAFNRRFFSPSEEIITYQWVFTIQIDDTKHLRNVALISDLTRSNFSVKWVKNINDRKIGVNNNSEWYITDEESNNEFSVASSKHYKIQIEFTSMKYDTYRQNLIFHFGELPVILYRLCVDHVPQNYGIPQDMTRIINKWENPEKNPEKWMWLWEKLHVFPSPRTEDTLDKMAVNLSKIYSRPSRDFIYPQQANSNLHQNSMELYYGNRLHELIDIEAMARNTILCQKYKKVEFEIISQFDQWRNGQWIKQVPRQGERFAQMEIPSFIQEIEFNRCIVLLRDEPLHDGCTSSYEVFEALIERQTIKYLYIRISEECVRKLNLPEPSENKIPLIMQYVEDSRNFCYWHWAIDRLENMNIIFPSDKNVNIFFDYILWRNLQMTGPAKTATYAIMRQGKGIPNLLVGPFGTGKTYIIAHALQLLLKEREAARYKILVCTQSNSAADIYVREYFDKFYTKTEDPNLRPLRIYKTDHDLNKVDSIVKKYCLIENETQFREPQERDFDDRHLIVTTVENCVYLANLNLQLSHIVIDEATQITECETLIAITTENQEDIRLTLAGDLARFKPDIKSIMAKDQGLDKSLLHRLAKLYKSKLPPPNFSNLSDDQIADHLRRPFSNLTILKKNEYTRKEIIDFIKSEYKFERYPDNDIIPVRNENSDIPPFVFHHVEGSEMNTNSGNFTSYVNDCEMKEIIKRVQDLQNNWPDAFPPYGERSIAILANESAQVELLRTKFTDRDQVTVDEICNVQGRHFDVVFISVVRTQHRGNPTSQHCIKLLTSKDLLYSAMTRANLQLVVVANNNITGLIETCVVLKKFIEKANKKGGNKSNICVTCGNSF